MEEKINLHNERRPQWENLIREKKKTSEILNWCLRNTHEILNCWLRNAGEILKPKGRIEYCVAKKGNWMLIEVKERISWYKKRLQLAWRRKWGWVWGEGWWGLYCNVMCYTVAVIYRCGPGRSGRSPHWPNILNSWRWWLFFNNITLHSLKVLLKKWKILSMWPSYLNFSNPDYEFATILHVPSERSILYMRPFLF